MNARSHFLPVLFVSLVTLVAAGGFGCGGTTGQNADGGPTDGATPNDGGGDPDGGGTVDGGTDGGGLDAGRADANPQDPRNEVKDTDCDGLSDAEEFSRTYAGGLQTDPNDPDSDGDGVPDGIEAGRTTTVDPTCTAFVGDQDATTTTDPTQPDSDADGVPDGLEDANHDGKVEAGETDPRNPDSDGDGLSDGCEDANHNGVVDTGETDPRLRDTDGDGIPDGIEDRNQNCRRDPGETDPTNPDTDGDGILDGNEDRNWNGVVDPGETDPLVPDVDTDHDGITDQRETSVTHTDPNKADTDGDGLIDGLEDKNQNGQVNVGETDPLRVDTDCDGLTDGEEDANHNGKVDPGETDPTNPDTDGDGLSDGLESGVATSPDAAHCPGYVGDADPSTTTDPLNPDTDGDGIMDGAEDRNGNGRVDGATADQPAELDPNNGSDANQVVTTACSTQNLVQVLFRMANAGDVDYATLQSYGDVTTLEAGGDDVGVMVYDPATKIMGIALANAAGTDASADLAAARAAFGSTGGEVNAITQPFTTWDGYAAYRGTLDWGSGADIKTSADAWVNAVRGGLTGQWGTTAGASGAFKVSLEVVHRSSQRAIYVAAVAPAAGISEATRIAMDDLANGSPLAQVGDSTGVQCDTFLTARPQPVDFLYVIDNSVSMGDEQVALSNATNSTVAQLENSTLDWRIGVITTDYWDSSRPAYHSFAGFTTDLATFQTRTTPGTNGGSNEAGLQSAEEFVTVDGAQLRPDAKLVVLILSDEDEHSSGVDQTTQQQYIDFFRSRDISVNALTCLPGSDLTNCYLNRNDDRISETYINVVTALGGVLGHIEDLGNIGNTVSAVISNAGAITSPYVLSQAPISATLKLAMDQGGGTVVQVPRSRTDGFDYDGASHSLQIFGSYRPAASGLDMAVSYRYWNDLTPDPNGTPIGSCTAPFVWNPTTGACECPADCGASQPGPEYTCDPVSCTWTCPADCSGACTGYEQCNQATCGCECRQSMSCATGFVFDTTACDCVCDPGQLACGANYQPDLAACACVCGPDCNGNCNTSETCNTSTCHCDITEIP